jgi:hypothetical protein
MPVYLASDYGFSNPTVILFIQVDIWGNVYVIGEYYHNHKTIDEVAKEIWNHPRMGSLVRVSRKLYPDPEDPGSSTHLAKAWNVEVATKTGGLIRDRIDLIRRHLKIGPDYLEHNAPERAPRLFFDFSCVNSIREMLDYRYPETKSEINESENPLKKDDHAPEALGRFFRGHFSDEVRNSGQARQRTARSA